MPQPYIGFTRALRETLAHIHPGEALSLPVSECEGHVIAEELFSRVDSPSTHTSLKDGYALRAVDGKRASGLKPLALPVTGSLAAGQMESGRLG